MRPLAPRFEPLPGVEEVMVGEEQLEYAPVVVARVTMGNGEVEVFTRWTFTPEERRLVAQGGDIYFSTPHRAVPHNITLRPEWAGPETT